MKDKTKGYERLWSWFGLSRASWITIPRSLAHSMPDEWQNKFAKLMEEYDRTWTNFPEGTGARVQITKNGRFYSGMNWIMNYRHPDEEKIKGLKSK